MSFEDIIVLAESGNTDAMVAAIQEFVWNEHIAVEESEELREKTLQYLNMAILKGNVTAMNQLGAMYAEGKIVERDPEQSFLFYKMASDKGHALATSNLGFCYLYGLGTEKNAEEAYKAFSKAAFLDIGDAYVRLGDMFRNGLYVTEDIKTAFVMYKKAYYMSRNDKEDWGMQQVYSDACLRIGDYYFVEESDERDVEEALKWYSRALKVYKIREEKGDPYSSKGYQRTKEQIRKVAKEIG